MARFVFHIKVGAKNTGTQMKIWTPKASGSHQNFGLLSMEIRFHWDCGDKKCCVFLFLLPTFINLYWNVTSTMAALKQVSCQIWCSIKASSQLGTSSTPCCNLDVSYHWILPWFSVNQPWSNHLCACEEVASARRSCNQAIQSMAGNAKWSVSSLT